jgi:hypothetical protein
MAIWVIGAVGSTAALACVAHFFAWFFWNPIGFADWYYRDGALKFVSAIYGLTVWLAMSYYIYIIIAHALSWMPPWIDFGDATTAEGVAMLGGSVLWLRVDPGDGRAGEPAAQDEERVRAAVASPGGSKAAFQLRRFSLIASCAAPASNIPSLQRVQRMLCGRRRRGANCFLVVRVLSTSVGKVRCGTFSGWWALPCLRCSG